MYPAISVAPAKYSYDLFVSYGHLDDLPLGLEAEEWVAQLVNRLQERLEPRLGRPPNIWRDERLPGNAVLWPALAGYLDRSAVLLALVSPAYARSAWCRREIEHFLRADGRFDSRLVRVTKFPVDEVRLAPELRVAPAYRFCEPDPTHGRMRELWPGDDQFQKRLDELAIHITSVLKSIQAQTA
jgi:hypothetical protein